MNRDSKRSPAAELWLRFAGMFGRDAVARKFGETIPQEWEAMLSRLSDYQLERGLRRLAYSGKAHVPTLPEFVKFCREVGGEYDEPKVIALPAADTWRGDGWDINANMHLRAHISRRLACDPRCYGPVQPYAFSGACYSPEQERSTRILVGWKNAWARDMREGVLDQATGEIQPPSIEYQKRNWDAHMERAEQQIAAQFAKAAA